MPDELHSQGKAASEEVMFGSWSEGKGKVRTNLTAEQGRAAGCFIQTRQSDKVGTAV